jgi:hypothetical protein
MSRLVNTSMCIAISNITPAPIIPMTNHNPWQIFDDLQILKRPPERKLLTLPRGSAPCLPLNFLHAAIENIGARLWWYGCYTPLSRRKCGRARRHQRILVRHAAFLEDSDPSPLQPRQCHGTRAEAQELSRAFLACSPLAMLTPTTRVSPLCGSGQEGGGAHVLLPRLRQGSQLGRHHDAGGCSQGHRHQPTKESGRGLQVGDGIGCKPGRGLLGWNGSGVRTIIILIVNLLVIISTNTITIITLVRNHWLHRHHYIRATLNLKVS